MRLSRYTFRDLAKLSIDLPYRSSRRLREVNAPIGRSIIHNSIWWLQFSFGLKRHEYDSPGGGRLPHFHVNRGKLKSRPHNAVLVNNAIVSASCATRACGRPTAELGAPGSAVGMILMSIVVEL